MSTLSRKQREIGQRERLLLGVARKMLIEQGYAGLTMDRLAEATEYSKGTIYQHFSTKEDLVMALAVESNEQRLALFGKARNFRGRPRERMLAFGVADELFARLHPHYFHAELIIRMADLENRASSHRRETMVRQDGCILGWVREIVAEAANAGDLPHAPSWTLEEMVFAILSLAIGAHSSAINFPHMLQELGVVTPLAAQRNPMPALLDGFGWRPLRTEWDYDATYRRLIQEVFPDESRRAELA